MKKLKAKFRVGDLVSFLLVGRVVRGRVTEYRGKLGLDGQDVFDVLVEFDSSAPMHFELEESFIQPAEGTLIPA
jgi:hypothetical protein